jgi:curved DNA-binding protein
MLYNYTMTHYETLGISENANQDEIKKAYRKLANQHHPDKGGDTNKFQQIQSAYETLSDNQKRAQYDSERRGMGGFRFSVNGQDMGGTVPPEMEEMLRNFGFGFSFGPGFASHGDPFAHFRQPRRNKDIQVELTVSLASTLEPQLKTVSVQNSRGERYSVDVTIPRGVRPNSTIKYPGLGDNLFESLQRGDLYVKIQVEGDPRFDVSQIDLITTVDLDAIHAIIGHELGIDGLDNKKFIVTVPPGTQNGTKFRIPSQGLYAMNQSSRGSLIVVVNITVPTNLSSSQLELLKNISNSL